MSSSGRATSSPSATPRIPNLAAVRHRLEGEPGPAAHGPYAVVWAVCRRHRGPVPAGGRRRRERHRRDRGPAVLGRPGCLAAHLRPAARGHRPAACHRRRSSTCSTGCSGSSWRSTGGEEAPAIRDVDDHARRIVEKVDAFRDDARQRSDGARDAWSSRRTTRRCGGWPSSALSRTSRSRRCPAGRRSSSRPTLVGTIYGMNFDYMPELQLGLRLSDGARADARDEPHAVHASSSSKGWL